MNLVMAELPEDGMVDNTSGSAETDRAGMLVMEVAGLDKVAREARSRALEDVREALSESVLTPVQERALLNLALVDSGIQQEFTGAVMTCILGLRGTTDALDETDIEIQALNHISNLRDACCHVLGRSN